MSYRLAAAIVMLSITTAHAQHYEPYGTQRYGVPIVPSLRIEQPYVIYVPVPVPTPERYRDRYRDKRRYRTNDR